MIDSAGFEGNAMKWSPPHDQGIRFPHQDVTAICRRKAQMHKKVTRLGHGPMAHQGPRPTVNRPRDFPKPDVHAFVPIKQEVGDVQLQASSRRAFVDEGEVSREKDGLREPAF